MTLSLTKQKISQNQGSMFEIVSESLMYSHGTNTVTRPLIFNYSSSGASQTSVSASSTTADSEFKANKIFHVKDIPSGTSKGGAGLVVRKPKTCTMERI